MTAVAVVGLTGGIGSGKSTVVSLLADKGAVIVDADRISHEVMAPGGEAYQPVIDRFGPGIVAPDGTIDRAAVAAIVFRDPAALADQQAITWPVIGKVMAERVAGADARGAIVVMDIPLLQEAAGGSRYGLAAVVVVDTPVEVALERLVGQRGMTEADARARIANQVGREQRIAIADHVIDNGGTLEELRAQVEAVWAELSALAAPPDES
jgi:dephospho-CoA kinase